MKWQGGRRSRNVVDRRGAGRPLAYGGGIAGLVIAVLALLFGGSLEDLGSSTEPAPVPGTGGAGRTGSPEDEQLREFVSVVLADTEDTWPGLLRPLDVPYQEPQLVLFRDAVESACGFAESAVGPFYCPSDARVYLDLSFFDDLEQLGAPGDFAQAYVIAHEIGHHVQNLLGISERAHAARQRLEPEAANAVSVRVELQADCFAGVWAHHAEQQRDLLEPGDVEEGLTAAASIGDDRLQKRAQGYVVPESFTHGSSAQRLDWFRRGFESGSVQGCDTFAR